MLACIISNIHNLNIWISQFKTKMALMTEFCVVGNSKYVANEVWMVEMIIKFIDSSYILRSLNLTQ